MSIVFFFDQRTPRRYPPHRTKKTIEDLVLRPSTAYRQRKKSGISRRQRKARSSFLSPYQGYSSSEDGSTPQRCSSAKSRERGGAGAFSSEETGDDALEATETKQSEEENTLESTAVPTLPHVHPLKSFKSEGATALTSSRLKIVLEVDEEREEDSQQQYNFQEAQFAAPGVLQQLSKLLYLENKDETVQWCPDTLLATLRSEHTSLTEGVKVPRRQWQTDSYRYTAEMSWQNRLPTIMLESDTTDGGGNGKKKKKDSWSRKDDLSATLSEVEMLKNERRQSGEEVDTVPSIFGLSREMSKSPHGQRPRTRLERYQVVGSKRRESTPAHDKQIHVGPHSQHEDVPKEFVSGVSHRGHTQTINFALSSNFATERGWVKEPVDSEDPERRTLLDWLQERSKQIKQQREVERKEAEMKGSDGPLVVRYYGRWPKIDMARLKFEARMKQGRLKRQGLEAAEEVEEKRCLTSQLPDGTAFCYYPSGQTALCRTGGGPGYLQKYTYVYDNDEAGTMLACFLPSGKGCGYHKHGSIQVLIDVDGGMLFDEEGRVTKKWKWPSNGMKLSPSVVVQLNEQIQLRCLSQTNIIIYFTCQQEIVKFQLAESMPQLMARPSSSSDSVFEDQLMTNVTFTSQSALDMSVPAALPKSPKKGKSRSSSRSSHKQKEQETPGNTPGNDSVLDTIDEEADDELVAYSTLSTDLHFSLNMKVLEQNKADLKTIQEKAKLLTNDWMDHYRKTLGISARNSPHSTPTRETSSVRQRRRSAEDGHVRAATADPLGQTQLHDVGLRHHRSVSAEPGRPTSRGSPSPMPELAQAARYRYGFDSVVGFESRKIPLVYDNVYDHFVQKELPRHQMLVVYVSDSRLGPDPSGCDNMLENIYYSRNKNRIRPSGTDMFRIVRYNLAVAADILTSTVPLLQRRHNAVPGMIFIYQSGRLLFANKIFNGYSNMRKDFLKQIKRSADDFRYGRFLLPNFRFGESSARSRSPEKAWVVPGSVEQLSEVSHRRPSSSSPIRLSPITAIGFITQSLSSEENLSMMHASHFHDLNQSPVSPSPGRSPASEAAEVSAIVGNA